MSDNKIKPAGYRASFKEVFELAEGYVIPKTKIEMEPWIKAIQLSEEYSKAMNTDLRTLPKTTTIKVSSKTHKIL